MARHKTELIYGRHSVRHALAAAPAEILELWIQAGNTSQFICDIQQILLPHDLPIHRVTTQQLDRLVSGGHHQGIVLRRRIPPLPTTADLIQYLAQIQVPYVRLLVLDGVQDPHNLGACLRVADAVGVHAVIINKQNTVGLTQAVRRVASGAADTVKIFYVHALARLLRQLKQGGIWIVGISADAELNLYTCDLEKSVAFVVGAEGKGIRPVIQQQCDEWLAIPMQGQVGSLNLSVAAGICLYEHFRQTDGNNTN